MSIMGRPRIDFNWTQFDKLCALPFITQEDICNIMGIDKLLAIRRIKEKYPEETFDTYRRKKHSNFKASLLAKQIEMAMKGNPTLLIWLGKQYLGQKDTQQITHEKSDDRLTIIIGDEGNGQKTEKEVDSEVQEKS